MRFLRVIVWLSIPGWVCFFLQAQNYEGQPVKAIQLQGLERTRDYIVTRELISQVGQPCLKENLEKERQRLAMLDIFSDIQIEPVLEDDSVVVSYKFVETFPFLPSVSIQINDENGISAGAGLKTPNLFGKDIYFSGRFLVGGANTGEIWLTNPWVTGNHLGYNLEYYYRERENAIADFNETANEIYLRIGSYLGENGRIGGSLESVNVRSDIEGKTLSPDNLDKVTRIGFYLGYDNRDTFSNTSTGWWNEIAVSREMRIFENASNFYQVDVDLRRYIYLLERHTLALFSLTTLRTGTVGADVAPWQIFGVGGTSTVRGWEFAARKGKNQFINTVEYRLTLLRPQLIVLPFNINVNGGIHMAFFGDMGIGWSEKNQFAGDNFIGGFGVGLRFLVPFVNMLRMDFGWGQAGKGVFLHLGAFEKSVVARRRVR